MSKTPYEIRLELLQLAKDRASEEHRSEWEKAAKRAELEESTQSLNEVPEYPTVDKLLLEAEKLKKFVDNNDGT